MNSERIYDYSTFEGKLRRLLRKFSNWGWLVLPIGVVTVFLLALAVLTPSDLSPETPVLESGSPTATLQATPVPILFQRGTQKKSSGDQSPCPTLPPTPAPAPGDSSNLKNGTFLFRPLGHPDILRNYSGLYAGLTEIQKVYLTKLEIRNVIIDGPLLSQRLADAHNLENIFLDQIGLAGNFTQVYLPNLKEFYFEQFRNAPTDDHKTFEALKKSLFFRLKEDEDWDVAKDVLNLGVNIKYVVSGSTILEVNRDQGLVNINSYQCEDFYRNIDNAAGKPVTRLSLAWCTVTDPNLLPLNTLQYLNLNNAVPEKVILSNLLRGAKELQEFHAFLPFTCDNASYISPDYPEIMIFLNLTDFSSTIRTVSLSKLAVYTLPLDYVSPIQDLTLETVNVTGILPNFHKNFANLSRVAIFNSTSDEDGYEILQEILKTEASWILMQSFNRNLTFMDTENFLDRIGVGKVDRDFLIEKDPISGNYTGRGISAFEKHYNRFNLLAFKDIDNYEIYTTWDAKFK